MTRRDTGRGGALTDPAYWAPYWTQVRLPTTISRKLGDPVVREMAERIRRYAALPAGAVVLEVGCAASAWLPFFHQQWGWRVEGIDYAAMGCVTARQNLALLEVPATVYEADVFDFATTHAGRYDLVASFGVVEHFMEPVEILSAMHRLLRPGGRIVVEVPHLLGLSGRLQRLASRRIMELHNPLSPADLHRHLVRAGFQEVSADYVGRQPLGVVNWPARNALPRLLWLGSMGSQRILDRACALAARALRLPPRWVASYVLAFGTKPDSTRGSGGDAATWGEAR